MHNLMRCAVAACMLTQPVGALAAVSDAEVADLRAQVRMLMARIEQLEAAATPPRSLPVAAASPVLEQRLDALESADAQRRQTIESITSRAGRIDWATRLAWKADLRYRHEYTDEDTRNDRTRHRIRARIGLDAVVSDTLSAHLGIATGSLDDPRSSNATLTDGNRRKEIGLDYAYVDWKAFAGATVTAGKMKYPFRRPGASMFYDGDVKPEGIALRFAADSGLFASLWGLWLDESSSGADANIVGAQVGWSGSGLTLIGSYQDYGAIENSTVGLADFGGNSTFLASGSNCQGTGNTPCYALDYNIVEVGAQYEFAALDRPALVWAGWIHNTEADRRDTGWNVGATTGKAKAPGTWELGVLYMDIEQDAQWGGFFDSDFAGGTTQGTGFQFKGAWAPANNVTLNLTYFLNKRNEDTPSERDYDRLQLDVNFKL